MHFDHFITRHVLKYAHPLFHSRSVLGVTALDSRVFKRYCQYRMRMRQQVRVGIYISNRLTPDYLHSLLQGVHSLTTAIATITASVPKSEYTAHQMDLDFCSFAIVIYGWIALEVVYRLKSRKLVVYPRLHPRLWYVPLQQVKNPQLIQRNDKNWLIPYNETRMMSLSIPKRIMIHDTKWNVKPWTPPQREYQFRKRAQCGSQ